MTREEKQFLLVDLCARLPYGVKVRHITESAKKIGASYLIDVLNPILYKYILEDNILAWPYLRPMSSMTEEEKQIVRWFKSDIKTQGAIDLYMNRYIEWLDSRHFDWRTDGNGKTLIEKGLAIEAPKEMYNI